MARIRTIKPEFWDSPDIGDVSRDARLTFIGLWNLADDHGRLEAVPAALKGDLFPYDDDVTVEMVCGWINDLARQGLVRLYASGRRAYLHITGWSDHQKIDRPSNPRCPDPDDCRPVDTLTPTIQRDLARADGQLVVAPVSTQAREPVAQPSRGPREPVERPSRPERRTVGTSERRTSLPAEPANKGDQHRELFDALQEACGLTGQKLTRSEGGRIAKAAKDLREVGATPDEVHAKAAAYRRKWPDVELTPTALVSNWAQLESRAGPVRRVKRADHCGECDQPLASHDDELHRILVRAAG